MNAIVSCLNFSKKGNICQTFIPWRLTFWTNQVLKKSVNINRSKSTHLLDSTTCILYIRSFLWIPAEVNKVAVFSFDTHRLGVGWGGWHHRHSYFAWFEMGCLFQITKQHCGEIRNKVLEKSPNLKNKKQEQSSYVHWYNHISVTWPLSREDCI